MGPALCLEPFDQSCRHAAQQRSCRRRLASVLERVVQRYGEFGKQYASSTKCRQIWMSEEVSITERKLTEHLVGEMALSSCRGVVQFCKS